MRWWLVLPVKEGGRAKSRFGDAVPQPLRADLARAMARDTAHAAAQAATVAGLLVVTDDAVLPAMLAPALAGRSAELVTIAEPRRATDGSGDAADAPDAADAADAAEHGSTTEHGLDAAALAGAHAARERDPGCGVAVLMADLPGLRCLDLELALRRAGAHERAFVPDAAGTGTTLLTCRAPHLPRPAYGSGSAERHESAGHVRLDLPDSSTLRHDVDLAQDLTALAGHPGGLTGALLAQRA
ncbi:2-phospho-L-lactate guanylyltransferase [Serinibacter salmoneus]|uniref:2-phospho-L-lactate guanylyltransferase n=1 Tax=Serinibacter salmoneus TaxID=556530 RepID=A0A2A9CXU3_9MICO|nr:2-phospho-L-lactate guanylyltransferase [Serinibacter salmoneus]PFG19258.1 2-phospho-L-lactate guanylyltransferase [Serinibacter salmoneus]